MLRSTSPMVLVTGARYSALDDSASGGAWASEILRCPSARAQRQAARHLTHGLPIALVTFHRFADFSSAWCCARLSSANDLGGIIELHTGEMGKAELYQCTGHVASMTVNFPADSGSAKHNTLYAPTRPSRLAGNAAVRCPHAASLGANSQPGRQRHSQPSA